MKNLSRQYRGKSILITGAAGFIGGRLLSILSGCDCKIHALDFKKIDGKKNTQGKLHWHCVDIRDARKVNQIIHRAKPDFIFHLAAVLPRGENTTISEMLEVNFVGTANLLSALKNIKFSKMVFIGSAAEYGISPVPHKEDQKLNPVNPYGVSKAAATQFCLAFAEQYNYPVVILRPTTVYGLSVEGKIFLPAFLSEAATREETFNVKKDYKRDFLYVDDLIEAILLAGISKIRSVVINVGTGKSISQKSAALIAKKILRSNAPMREKLAIPGEVKNDFCDVSRAKKLLGWKARHSLEDGLRTTLTYRER